MTIPQEILDKWQMYRSHGDMTSIAELAGVTSATVSNAFKNGRANEELIAVMSDFYSDKQERMDAYLNDHQE